MSKFATFNKGALRQAMRDAGLSYANMSVDEMRNALTDLHAGAAIGNAAAEVVGSPEHVAEVDAGVAAAEIEENLANAEVEQVPTEPGTPRVLPTLTPPPSTLEPEVAPAVPVSVGPRATSKGVKIEKDRPIQNGVKMPSAGTLCRAVWDYCQSLADAGTKVDAKTVKAHAATVGWNPNNASIEFYNWRKFNGITGRQK